MTLILAFIASQMGFLWKGARFWIAGSEITTSNGGDAYLLVESDTLRLRFVRDRGQLLLDFQPREHGELREWFSVDLIRSLFHGEPETLGVLDESYASIVRDHLDEIEASFAQARWTTTQSELKRLKAKCAKVMFG